MLQKLFDFTNDVLDSTDSYSKETYKKLLYNLLQGPCNKKLLVFSSKTKMKTGKLFELKLFGLKKETIQMLFNRLCLVTYGKVPETSLCVIL